MGLKVYKKEEMQEVIVKYLVDRKYTASNGYVKSLRRGIIPYKILNM